MSNPINDAANYACEMLPGGWNLTLMLELGSGYWVLTKPNCAEVEIPGSSFDGDSLDEQLRTAVRVAREMAGMKESTVQ